MIQCPRRAVGIPVVIGTSPLPLGLDSHHNHPPTAHWIAINLSIHHRRCRLIHQSILLNEVLGCAYARLFTKIFL